MDMEEFKKAAAPLIEWYQKNCDPHHAIIIENGIARVVSDEMGVPFEEEYGQESKEFWAETTETAKLGETLFGMARLTAKETGLPYDVLIDSVGADRQVHPDLPRCKIQISDYLVPILICKSPVILGAFPEFLEIENFDKIAEWVSTHEETLLRHWRKEITDSDALKALIDKRSDILKFFESMLHFSLRFTLYQAKSLNIRE